MAQKHDKVTCATKQIEWDSKDTDAINSCPRKVPIKLVRYTLQMEHLKAFSVEKFTLDGLIYPQTFFTCLFVFFRTKRYGSIPRGHQMQVGYEKITIFDKYLAFGLMTDGVSSVISSFECGVNL